MAPGIARANASRDRGVAPFELFCALHLGITPQNTYRPSNLPQVARRFNTTPEAIQALLERFAMDLPDLRRARFDLALAQLDQQVLPEGIDRTEQAKVSWQELLETSEATRAAVQAWSLDGDPVEDDEGGDNDVDEGDEDDEEEDEAEAPAASSGPRAARG